MAPQTFSDHVLAALLGEKKPVSIMKLTNKLKDNPGEFKPDYKKVKKALEKMGTDAVEMSGAKVHYVGDDRQKERARIVKLGLISPKSGGEAKKRGEPQTGNKGKKTKSRAKKTEDKQAEENEEAEKEEQEEQAEQAEQADDGEAEGEAEGQMEEEAADEAGDEDHMKEGDDADAAQADEVDDSSD